MDRLYVTRTAVRVLCVCWDTVTNKSNGWLWGWEKEQIWKESKQFRLSSSRGGYNL